MKLVKILTNWDRDRDRDRGRDDTRTSDVREEGDSRKDVIKITFGKFNKVSQVDHCSLCYP